MLVASSTSPTHSIGDLGYGEERENLRLKLIFQLCRLRPFVNRNLFGFSLFGSSTIRDCDCRSCSFGQQSRRRNRCIRCSTGAACGLLTGGILGAAANFGATFDTSYVKSALVASAQDAFCWNSSGSPTACGG